MSDEYLKILRKFGNALADCRYDEAVQVHYPPVPMVDTSGVRLLDTHAALADDLAKLWPSYHQAGVRAMRPHILHTTSHDPHLALVDVEWSLFTARGGLFTAIYSTYGFINRPEGLRIVSIVSHNERLERPATAV